MSGQAKTGLRRVGSSQSTETKGTESEGSGLGTARSEDLESVRASSTRSQSECQGAVEIFGPGRRTGERMAAPSQGPDAEPPE